jgi:ABC-2 type transport system ATP-binding protein
VSATPAIRIEGLRKSFGEVRAVNDVSFEIPAGQVVGFIGANGAGKTTTMRMMASLDHPDEGRIEICGHDVVQHPGFIRRHVGWMPDAYGTYEAMTVWEYLDFFARAYGFHGAEGRARVDEVMAFTDLAAIADRPMNGLSKGMAQRLCLGRTLLNDPDVLILDEPAAGLDPKARIDFKRLVRLLGEQGKTLFISSHILTELEEMCDAMLFIDRGTLVHHGSSASLKRREGMPVLVRVGIDGPPERLTEWVSLHPGVEVYDTDRQGVRVRVESGDPAHLAELLRAMVRAELPVTEFHREDVRLEDVFVDILNRSAPGDRHVE